jgi:hypothetical protein
VANAAVYLPCTEFDLADAVAGAVATRSADGRVARFDVTIGGQSIQFNVMPAVEVSRHVAGFAGYVDSLDEPLAHRAEARKLIRNTKAVLGLVASGEFEDNPALWESLFRIAEKWDGFVFVYDSVVLANGEVVVGPLEQDTESDADDEA